MTINQVLNEIRLIDEIIAFANFLKIIYSYRHTVIHHIRLHPTTSFFIF